MSRHASIREIRHESLFFSKISPNDQTNQNLLFLSKMLNPHFPGSIRPR